MADMQEVYGLLHVHKMAHEHGEAFRNIKDAAWERLQQIDKEHAEAKAYAARPKPMDNDAALIDEPTAPPEGLVEEPQREEEHGA